MKKLLPLLLTISLFACSDDDTTETHPFRDSMISLYKLKAIYTDTALDLNEDGVPQTDLLEEACIASTFFDGYLAEFKYNEWYDYSQFTLDIPSSEYSMFLETMTPCFDKVMLYNGVEINEQTKQITITDRYEEREAEHGSVTSITCENGVIHFIVNKELYTPEGWRPVTIHFKYEKWDPSAEN